MQAAQELPPDSIRAVLREVFADPAYEWTITRTLWDVLRDAWHGLQTFLDRLADQHPVAFLALLLALLAVFVAIVTHIAFVLRRALRRPVQGPLPDQAGLPRQRDAAWHLDQALQLARAGRYGEACGHRFIALLLDLERRKALTVRPSRTPAEYAREVRLDPDGRAIFGGLVSTLYAVLFGGQPADATVFAAFDREAGALVHRAPAR